MLLHMLRKQDTVDSVLADEALKVKRLQDIIDRCNVREEELEEENYQAVKDFEDKYETLRKAYAEQVEAISLQIEANTIEVSKAKVALNRYK